MKSRCIVTANIVLNEILRNYVRFYYKKVYLRNIFPTFVDYYSSKPTLKCHTTLEN